MMENDSKTEIREAVADGLRQVLGDKAIVAQFWDGAFEALQQRAQHQTGRFLLGTLGVVARKAVMFCAIGLIVYSLGGWAALVKLWNAMSH